MKITLLKKECLGEQDGYIVHRIYTSDGGVSITRKPILSEEEYNRRKQQAIDVLSEIDCRLIVRQMKAQSAV